MMNRDRLIELLGAPVEGGSIARGDHELTDSDAVPLEVAVPAAVLIPLVDRTAGITVLLTRRTSGLRHHGGQISFPGGRMEAGDLSPELAALRETEEEIGLRRHCIQILGRLDCYVTRTGFAVTPVVALVSPSCKLTLDAREVEEVFEVPLDFLLDSKNYGRRRMCFDGEEQEFYAVPWGDYFIWGATAGMLNNLCQRLGGS